MYGYRVTWSDKSDPNTLRVGFHDPGTGDLPTAKDALDLLAEVYATDTIHHVVLFDMMHVPDDFGTFTVPPRMPDDFFPDMTAEPPF